MELNRSFGWKKSNKSKWINIHQLLFLLSLYKIFSHLFCGIIIIQLTGHEPDFLSEISKKKSKLIFNKMKFIVSSNALLKSLQAISGVLSSNNTLPILDDFLFDVGENTLKITASDLETTMSVKMERHLPSQSIYLNPWHVPCTKTQPNSTIFSVW